VLTWQDNFSDAAGSPPDPSKWGCCTNQMGGGNGEAQYYAPQNVRGNGGGLVLAATTDTGTYQGYNGPSTILSGKVWTKERFAWRYGHLAVNATVPAVPGAWPAIWMLGQNYDDVGWPECGEIDIMEWFGQTGNLSSISGSLHSATDNLTQAYTLPRTNAAQPHTYTLDWRPTALAWGVDGVIYQTALKADLTSWPFDQPMFLVMNLAIGGTQGGPVPAASQLPLEMVVNSVKLSNAEVCTGPGTT
jgi:beta-glucanase (GH16 family)